MSHIFKYLIQETDLDFVGHVNNATYVRIYEQARWQLLFDNGYSLKEIRRTQQSPVILSINISYLKELTARQSIDVHTKFIEFKNKVGQLEQKMLISESDVVACTAEITYGIFDMKTRKLIAPSQEWLDIIH